MFDGVSWRVLQASGVFSGDPKDVGQARACVSARPEKKEKMTPIVDTDTSNTTILVFCWHSTVRWTRQTSPETQNETKEAARFMTGSTSAASCMLKRLCKYYSEVPVLCWSFPYQDMPSEIRAVTDAKWAGELEGLRSTSYGWIYFGDHLL